MNNQIGKKSTLKNSFIYGLGNVATKIIGLILIPLYTNPTYLSVEDFGFLGILKISSQVLVAIMSFFFSKRVFWFWFAGRNYVPFNRVDLLKSPKDVVKDLIGSAPFGLLTDCPWKRLPNHDSPLKQMPGQGLP